MFAAISKLSPIQRRILLSHIDGPRRINFGSATEHLTLDALRKNHLLREHPTGTIRPKSTELTESGRLAVARLLAEYAEALILAGCLELDPGLTAEERPMRMLRRLKQIRADMPASPPQTASPAQIRGK